jgi:two-component sensor histidine kinase
MAMQLKIGEYPFLTFVPVVVVAAIFLGTMPALFVTLVGITISVYFYVPPIGLAIHHNDILPLALAMSIALGFIYIIDLYRRCMILLYQRKCELRELVDNQEVMFTELQHRVANNMQFLASLMRLQRQFVTDSDKTEILTLYDKQIARVEMMGKLHRALHNPGEVGGSLKEYLSVICRDSFNFDIEIWWDIKGDDSEFELSKLTPLTLIIAELITNSIKYAFDNRSSGCIKIAFETVDDKFTLTYQDDSPGVREVKDHGLGSKIILGLVRQLHGTFTPPPIGGSLFTLSFPHPCPHKKELQPSSR